MKKLTGKRDTFNGMQGYSVGEFFFIVRDDDEWVIYHKPTGKTVSQHPVLGKLARKKDAIQFLESLLDMGDGERDWDFTEPTHEQLLDLFARVCYVSGVKV